MPALPPIDPNLEQDFPGEAELIARIAAAARRVVLSTAVPGQAPLLRDVHPKQHGCVVAQLTVLPNLGAKNALGVFATPRTYDALVRFSNSNKVEQSDQVPDGRGIAIKLLDVAAGPRAVLDDPDPGTTHDFILLNGPAFFAADVRDMAELAEAQANDSFPGGFFARLDRFRGLQALLHMAVKDVRSPLDLTYFSQTAYLLGPGEAVKYRLQPAHSLRPFEPKNPHLARGNHLYHALRDDLAPVAGNAAAQQPRPPSGYRFTLSVQRRSSRADVVEDGTVVWKGPFVDVAVLSFPQQYVGKLNWQTAAKMAFSPWNALQAHQPLGSLNRARYSAYIASRTARGGASPTASDYREKLELLRAQSEQDDSAPEPLPTPGGVVLILAALRGVLAAPLAKLTRHAAGMSYALGLTLLGAGALVANCWPKLLLQPVVIPLLAMPSESSIPEPKLRPEYRGKSEAQLATEAKYLFRYGSIGTQLQGGVPYWIFSVLPELYPAAFAPEGDYTHFGLGHEHGDADYYEDYYGLPRGFVLGDMELFVGGSAFKVPLKLVSFNCASCHRGNVKVGSNDYTVDGMPNVGLDAAEYKKVIFGLMRRDDFTADRVVDAIEQRLAALKKPALEPKERAVYRLIVATAKHEALQKPIAWLGCEPDNGPGRLDAFGALRYEFLGYDYDDPRGAGCDADGGTAREADGGAAAKIATVDLPSIWNQNDEIRPWHHYDGNTQDVRARNFGAIVGVGGAQISIPRDVIDRIGGWIESDELKPLKFEEAGGELADEQVAAGRGHYEAHCQTCHGQYDQSGKPVKHTVRVEPVVDGGTDPHRKDSIDQEFVDKLNGFGMRNGLWHDGSFRPATGYLAPPLDGIWLRAPYLHNGSVPTLEALLSSESGRPEVFCRKSQLEYEPDGTPIFDSPAPPAQCSVGFTFDTKRPGNSNRGHDHIVADPDKRKALIAYLMTL